MLVAIFCVILHLKSYNWVIELPENGYCPPDSQKTLTKENGTKTVDTQRYKRLFAN